MMKKRILVVEDQVDNRRILRDLLTNADYEIIEAENGEEALAAAAAPAQPNPHGHSAADPRGVGSALGADSGSKATPIDRLFGIERTHHAPRELFRVSRGGCFSTMGR
jgi:hypothetical protein